HSANAVRARRIVTRGCLLEDTRLDLLVGCGAERLGDVESDLAGRERFENDRRKLGEAQATLDEADREPEAASDILDGRATFDERRESLRLVGGVHRQAVEIFCEARFDCTVVILED